jgi:triosephosphate isomerase (TIM)
MATAPKPLIAGNWKMHATHLEAIQMVQKLSYRLDLDCYERVDVVVCPPATALRSVQTVIETDHMSIRLGAQNCYWEEKGAFTGEISPSMLAKLDVGYVIAGHSERRQLLGETDDMVNRKVKAILAHSMVPIMCVGETLQQREDELTADVVKGQVEAGLRGIGGESAGSIAIAYEPIWAIGTGRNASAEDAAETIDVIRSTVGRIWGNDAVAIVRILYGGSVNPGNIAGFMAKRGIDGALVGGASLDPDTFAAVVQYWKN